MMTIGDKGRTGGNWLLATVSPLVLMQALPAAAQSGGAAQTTRTNVVQVQQTYLFDIPSKPLPQAIADFSAVTGIQVLYTEPAPLAQTAPALRGTYTAQQALQRLLAGSGLSGRYTSANAVTIERPRQENNPAVTTPNPVTVERPRQADTPGAITLAPITVEAVAERGRFGDAPPEPGGFKADYQTSATKTPLPIKETPQAITVTTRESIDARQARDVTSALELTAGISSGTGSNGGPFAGFTFDGGNQYNLRGQTLSGNRDVRIDGFAVGSVNNTFDLAAFERIEVIKGPASTLYGQGSLGGFINMVRKKPQAEPRVSVVGQIGSFDTYRGEVDATGAFDADKRFLGQLSAVYENAGSFIDGVESQRLMLAPSLEARIGSSTRALLQVLAPQDEFTPTPGIPLLVVGKEAKAPRRSRRRTPSIRRCVSTMSGVIGG